MGKTVVWRWPYKFTFLTARKFIQKAFREGRMQLAENTTDTVVYATNQEYSYERFQQALAALDGIEVSMQRACVGGKHLFSVQAIIRTLAVELPGWQEKYWSKKA